MYTAGVGVDEPDSEEARRRLGEQPEGLGPIEDVLGALVGQEATLDVVVLEDGRETAR